MKFLIPVLLLVLSSSFLHSQTILETQDPNQTLSPEHCMELFKSAWDELKKLSDDYHTAVAERNEFESTTDYADRVRKGKDDFVANIRKFYSDHKLGNKVFSVWLKTDLNKYDADNQTYGLSSPTQLLVQPKKKDIAVLMTENKYVTITEKNSSGYRRAFIHLNTKPEFTWFVNKKTAQEAKSKEADIFFKVGFSFDVSYSEATDQVILQVVPAHIALMNKAENFTYWSEDVH